jgi:hypothetical protein
VHRDIDMAQIGLIGLYETPTAVENVAEQAPCTWRARFAPTCLLCNGDRLVLAVCEGQRLSEQKQRLDMAGHRAQYFPRLLDGERRVARKQAPRMGQRHVERSCRIPHHPEILPALRDIDGADG